MAQIVVIKHTEVNRGDHGDAINEAYIFEETATLKDILATLGTINRPLKNEDGSFDKDENGKIVYAKHYYEAAWFEIPVQKQISDKVL